MATGILHSGTGAWTLTTPANTTLAIDDIANPLGPFGDPVPVGDFVQFPTVRLVITLASDGTSTTQIVGDDSSHFPGVPDSIGYTSNMQLVVVNDTGHALSGLTLSLANLNPTLPHNGGSSVVHWGEADYDANYAYFTQVQPVAGENVAMYDPNGNPTTPTGPAPSTLVLTGNIAAGATVESDSVVHNTELSVPNNDFDVSVTDTPAAGSPGLTVFDTSTNQSTPGIALPYTGPVAGLTEEYINLTSDNINITATTPNWFLHSGTGEDAIQVTSGNNVLDGGTGSNFLVGGSGQDQFYVDDRGATTDIWSTVAGFHSGDSATVWGVTPQDFGLNWVDGQGATGFTGLTLHATAAGKPTASLTLTGYTTADLNNGRLGVTFGTVDSNTYMNVRAA